MATTAPLQKLADAVQSLFVEQRGAFRPADFIAVAELLGYHAHPRLPSTATPPPTASNYFADLFGTNLQHALATYAWGDWRPLSDDGVTISGFWDCARDTQPPAGYVLAADGRYGQRH